MTHDEIIATIPKTARDLSKITDMISDQQMQQRRVDGHWSVKQLIGHLRDASKLFAARIALIAREDDPQLANADTDAMVANGNYNALDAEQLIAEIATLDNNLVHLLQGLSEADWQRSGVHATNGPQTIEYIATYHVNHAQGHLDDLWERVNSC